MSKVTGELLPCPFCGGVNVFLRDDDPQNTWVECDDCQVGTLTTLGWPECVAAWNRRAALEAVSSIHEAEPIGYIRSETLAALREGKAGPIVGVAAFDTTIPLYAHPAPISKGVTVKALEWVQFTARAGDLSAKSMVGEYVIRPGVVGGAHFRLWLPGQDYNAAQRFDTSEAAQSAAQADFDARVLACLSHTAGEP